MKGTLHRLGNRIKLHDMAFAIYYYITLYLMKRAHNFEPVYKGQLLIKDIFPGSL
jgi:hypothetical protein